MSRVSTASPTTASELAHLLSLAAVVLGCRVYSAGLATDGTAGDSSRMGDADSDDGGKRPAIETLGGSAIEPNAYGGDAGGPVDLPLAIGAPVTVGCSDGTREGFRDIKNWPKIAGCSGGWTWHGLLDSYARKPLCNRAAGNDSHNPGGLGCSATDLCALTWHVCRDGPDVASSSPTGGCESIVSPGEEALFVVMAGASLQGVCYPGNPDQPAENDLHGCGSIGRIGQPESSGCPPLDLRMGFADCAATAGVWVCGTAADSLTEARVVTKPDSALGGVLCCRD